MSPYNQTTLAGAIVIVCVGVVGIALGLAWYRVVSPANFDKDTAFFIVKLFGAITAVLMLFLLLVRYG